MVNASALSANYRALSLSSTRVAGSAVFGAMEIAVDTDLASEVFVDGESFLQVLRSLPAGELKLAATASSLSWTCGAAKGQLALMGENLRVVPVEIPEDLQFTEVDSNFGRGLDRGGIACGSSALMSLGLYGVSITNGADVRAYSSDDNIIASARMGATIHRMPAVATLSPAGAKILTALTSSGKASVAVDDQTVYCRSSAARLMLKQIPPLKYKIADQLATFLPESINIPLKGDIIAAFIRRAEALTEEKRRTDVSISVTDGAVRLSFIDGKSSSEEYYLAEGGGAISVDPILVDSRRLARALGQASRIAFDHIERGALVLRGDQEFVFVIAGKSPE
jgi:hypothetical protein